MNASTRSILPATKRNSSTTWYVSGYEPSRPALAADEARGLVVYRTFEDLPASAGRENSYPLTYQVVELFRFVDGRIERVEAFTSELPFGMRPHDARE